MTNRDQPGLCGILNLNKPIGVTSRDVVNLVSRPLRKQKVGHAGTLDPLASGVLVVCVGPATRLIEYVQRMRKTYRATIRLGATSDTLDSDGTIVETEAARVPVESEIIAALAQQVGTILQIPPQFSALKVAGKRAYDLARAGEEVELAARPVEVYRASLLGYAWPRFEVEIECGSGTYIRSIARDVGETLGCGGLIEVLTRTRIGSFSIETAIDPQTLDRDSIPAHLRPMTEAVGGLVRIDLSADDLARIRLGQSIASPCPAPPSEVALFSPDGSLSAIAEPRAEGRLAPSKVFLGR